MLEKFNYKEALSAADFKAQTLAQLQKDLDRAQCAYQIESEEFLNELAVFLTNLSAEKRAQLLYLIDLPENNSALRPTGHYFEDLAEQIIHREALKVFWRQRFSRP
ncbi:MAG: hypothetical protein ACKOWX_10730 [Flavobacteriales bacterium]